MVGVDGVWECWGGGGRNSPGDRGGGGCGGAADFRIKTGSYQSQSNIFH